MSCSHQEQRQQHSHQDNDEWSFLVVSLNNKNWSPNHFCCIYCSIEHFNFVFIYHYQSHAAIRIIHVVWDFYQSIFPKLQNTPVSLSPERDCYFFRVRCFCSRRDQCSRLKWPQTAGSNLGWLGDVFAQRVEENTLATRLAGEARSSWTCVSTFCSQQTVATTISY